MPSSTVTLKAAGLNYSPNNLALPEGSLVVGNDVIIQRDNVVQSRRGYLEYSEDFLTSTDRAKQLMIYKERIIAHFQDKLFFDTGETNLQGKAVFGEFNGDYEETEEGLRIKSIQAQKNLYFTTSEGIKKLSVSSVDDFSTAPNQIVDAGAVKALDFTAFIDIAQGQQDGFFPVNSVVAYRVVWGYRDANNNIILGAPSDRVVVYNFLQNALVQDINAMCVMLDNLKQNGVSNYSVINPSSSFSSQFIVYDPNDATQVLTNTKALATLIDESSTLASISAPTVTTPLQINQIDITNNEVTISFTAGNPQDVFVQGDVIEITGITLTGLEDINNGNTWTDTSITPNVRNTNPAYYTITNVGLTTITFNFIHADVVAAAPGAATVIKPYSYRRILETSGDEGQFPLNDIVVGLDITSAQMYSIQNALERISNRLKIELVGFISANLLNRYVSPYQITTTGNVNINITVPVGVREGYFYQVYRSAIFTGFGTDILGVTILPDDELRLVNETTITTPIPNSVEYFDNYPDDLRNNNANLYTNPVTGEGIQNANDLPPFAKDIEVFKNVTFYFNTKTKHRINPFQLLGTSLLDSGDTITVTNGLDTSVYTFIEGVKEETQFTISNVSVASIETNISDLYFTINTPIGDNEKNYYVWYSYNNAGTDPAPTGLTGIRVDLLTGDTANTVAEKTAYAISQYIYDFTATNINAITNVVAGSPTTTITTDYPHSLVTGNSIVVSGVTQTGGTAINGTAVVVTVTGANTFTIPTASSPTGVTFTNASIEMLNSFIVTNISEGYTTASAIGPGTISTIVSITSTTPGAGEDAANNEVLLSRLTSRAQAIDLTARSLTRVINKDTNSTIYSYYISGDNTLPGLMNLESVDLNDTPFYVMGSNADVGLSFNPDIGPVNTNISAISAATSAVITTSSPHGLINGEQIVIGGSNSNPEVKGLFTITYLTPTTFSVPFDTTTPGAPGTSGFWSTVSDTVVSTNEVKPNRVYYSKPNQTESVPILNFFDVGSSDKQILRGKSIRDSLFVFKEDGLYRISGESIPFSTGLFDSSCVLIAPDSVSVSNNAVYGWTLKGVSVVNESGVSEITRPIDTEILKLSASIYPNFRQLTWGLSYDSDNSYTVFTNSQETDEVATIGFRYSNLTNTWTNINRAQTCGVILPSQDVQYFGSGTNNVIDKERKTFTRTDYADKDFTVATKEQNILSNDNKTVALFSVDDIEVGDVLTQTQWLTIFDYNSLLQKLDLDPTVGISDIASITGSGFNVTITTTSPHFLTTGDYVTIIDSGTLPLIDGLYQVIVTSGTQITIVIENEFISGSTSVGQVKRNYYNTLQLEYGINLRDALITLAQYLDTDPALVITTYEAQIENYLTGINIVSPSAEGIITTYSAHNIVSDRVVTIFGTPYSPDTIPVLNGVYLSSNNGAFGTSSVFNINELVISGATSISGLFVDTTPTENTALDIKACFDNIVSLLNTDSGATFSDYLPIDETSLIEAVILSVNTVQKSVTLNIPLPLVIGDVQIYKAIPCEIQYSPITFGDPLMLKQIYEATMMFDNKAFTQATASFSSDLKPEFTDIVFNGEGNGIYGHYTTLGHGYGFYGGGSHAAPFRTLIPMMAQRCRYLNVKFAHEVAREKWALNGITLTGNVAESTRAFR